MVKILKLDFSCPSAMDRETAIKRAKELFDLEDIEICLRYGGCHMKKHHRDDHAIGHFVGFKRDLTSVPKLTIIVHKGNENEKQAVRHSVSLEEMGAAHLVNAIPSGNNPNEF